MALVILCGVVAFLFLVLWNIRDRRTEKALAQLRGAQDVTSFAAMFSTDAERPLRGTYILGSNNRPQRGIFL